MSDKTERDPRLEPRPGDVLLQAPFRMEVTEINGRRVLYRLTQPGSRGIYAIPMACGVYLAKWRKVRAGAEVVKRAEERPDVEGRER